MHTALRKHVAQPGNCSKTVQIVFSLNLLLVTAGLIGEAGEQVCKWVGQTGDVKRRESPRESGGQWEMAMKGPWKLPPLIR